MSIKNFLQKGESQTVEFKDSFNRETLETAVAFSNTKGGTILIGIDNRGTVKGASVGTETLAEWSNRISQATEPTVIPELQSEEKFGGFAITFSKDIFSESSLKELGLNSRQIKAVIYVKEKGRITNTEYQALCDVKKRAAIEDIRKLVELNILERIGITGKGTYYILKGRHRGERGNNWTTKYKFKINPNYF